MKKLALLLALLCVAATNYVMVTGSMQSGTDKGIVRIAATNLCCATACFVTNDAPGDYVVICNTSGGCNVYQFTSSNILVYICPYIGCNMSVTNLPVFTSIVPNTGLSLFFLGTCDVYGTNFTYVPFIDKFQLDDGLGHIASMSAVFIMSDTHIKTGINSFPVSGTYTLYYSTNAGSTYLTTGLTVQTM